MLERCTQALLARETLEEDELTELTRELASGSAVVNDLIARNAAAGRAAPNLLPGGRGTSVPDEPPA